ncbi:MAG TPA: glycoside hydrolase family 38 C-terminal domain-containing protein [Chloroflexota bacterium]|nr:glycoside hydrolase family 38 C-terminal domain-containing protein [Chloroflexota bacterium]
MTHTAYLISHTHWDREWYRTFQQFRLDLVRTIDLILETLDTDPAFTHFMLDGQTIVLDDYLAMRPGRADDLRRHISGGRLSVGPWYCHPDLFLVSGESLVRNLLLGTRMARSYGHCMMVGYIPDQFGHCGQMPQILRGFGIDNAVLWRGVDARHTPNESWWEAPDGSRVFLELLAQSYSNAQALPLEPEALAERLRQLASILARTATGPGVVLMNGADHSPIQPGLPAALAGANARLAPEWRVEQAGLEEAMGRLQEQGKPRHVLRGELRSPATAHLLPGVLSARVPLKQRNARAQSLLEREVEPYAAWASLLGAAYPHGELWEAWRLLLQNQPHDSVCGCSIDQVHREMGLRFDAVEQIGTELAERARRTIADHIDTHLPPDRPLHSVPLVVFNPAPGPRTDRVRLSLQLPGVAAGYEVLDGAGRPVAHRWIGEGGEPSSVMLVERESIPSPDVVMAQLDGNRFMGFGLQSLIAELREDGLHVEAMVGPTGIMSREEIAAEMERMAGILAETDPAPVIFHLHHNNTFALELLAREVPAYGYTTLWLCPSDDETLGASPAMEATADAHRAVSGRRVENEYFTVEADAGTGALTVLDRANGVTYSDCNSFVDGGDAGDSYTYAAPSQDRVIMKPDLLPEIEAWHDDLGSCLKVVQVLRVPRALAPDRAARSSEQTEIRISSLITLTHGCPRIDIETTVVNTAEDHRLRVRFTAPFAVRHVLADGPFELVRRPPGLAATAEAALEDPVPDAPQQGLVVLDAGDHGLAVSSIGLPEYEALPAGSGTMLSLTLLRCVGWLSRDDIATRRGGAGPSLPVPEAQCPGTHTFSYSLIPYRGDWRAAAAEAQRFQVPLRAMAVHPEPGDLPAESSLLRVDAPGILVSAIKGAEDQRGIVVRLYNVGDDEATATLYVPWAVTCVERLTLDERPVEVLYEGVPSNAVSLRCAPHRIETLRLVP